jgi:gliding motility-associated-like protein
VELRRTKHTGILALIFLSLGAFAQDHSIYTPPEKTNCPRSQKQADIWYFGEKAGMDFRSGTAVTLTNEDVMTAYKASAVMSDSAGNLLFFSNGKKIWDNTFNLMPNATGLDGDVGVTQPVIIIPQPGNDSLYFVFTIDVMGFLPDNSYTTKGLRYTLVNMKLRGGLGDATTTLNVPLLTPVCQKLTATRNANGKDYWVIVHEWDEFKFYAYPVTASGIGSPVVSSIGALQGGGYIDQTNAYGYMKSSPDGSTLALAITGLDMIQLFNFNTSTGDVTNARSYTTSIPGVSPYGIEYSPDSRKLYASLLRIVGNGPPTRPSFVLQFDLDAGLVNPVIVDSTQSVRLSALQLGVDGRIYVARTINLTSKIDSLDVIYNPTRPGLACNYDLLNNAPQSRFPLLGRYGLYSLPNFIQNYVDVPIFTYDSICFGNITQFHITNKANIDSVLWDFGDGTTSAMLEPVHPFTKPGSFLVSLTEMFNGAGFTDTLTIQVHALPQVNLGDTILMYKGAKINLHAGGGFISYSWSTGSTDSTITVSDEGNYIVQVEDHNCCFNSDTVYIKVFQYFVPTAFTPNGDGLNDVFRVIGLYRNINFHMYIYNRWGGLIFESDNIDDGWDGTYKNGKCEPDTYAWVVHIDFLGQDILTNGSIVLKGTVILVK